MSTPTPDHGGQRPVLTIETESGDPFSPGDPVAAWFHHPDASPAGAVDADGSSPGVDGRFWEGVVLPWRHGVCRVLLQGDALSGLSRVVCNDAPETETLHVEQVHADVWRVDMLAPAAPASVPPSATATGAGPSVLDPHTVPGSGPSPEPTQRPSVLTVSAEPLFHANAAGLIGVARTGDGHTLSVDSVSSMSEVISVAMPVPAPLIVFDTDDPATPLLVAAVLSMRPPAAPAVTASQASPPACVVGVSMRELLGVVDQRHSDASHAVLAIQEHVQELSIPDATIHACACGTRVVS
jgi:hypothetical protein